jgi:hypothetical protein
MGDFEISIEKLFQRLSTEGLGNIHQRLIPLIINLDIPEDLSTENTHFMRIFLKKLRVVHQNYFVRFRTSILWAAESDNTDIFYTYDEFEDKHFDATLHVRIFDKKTILINADIPRNTRRNTALKCLSKSMLEEIPAQDESGDELAHLEAISDFYVSSGISDVLEHEGDDTLHVMFIPGWEGIEYHALPLYGLTQRDAKHRFLSIERNLDFLSIKHQMVIPEKLDTCAIMEALIEIIQMQVDHGDRYTLAKDVYALTELLYAYHLVTPNECKSKDKNELLLFEIIELIDETTKIEVYSIEHKSVSI